MLHSRNIVACLGLLLIFGCGSDVYESRLAETNAFFQYRQSLDRVLQNGVWSSPVTISMRIPKGFNLQPAPPPAKEGEPAPEDERQLNFLGLQLPGIVGAWKAVVACDNGTYPAFLFVCSNHQAYLDRVGNPKEAPDPEVYLTDLENALSNVMQVTLPPGEMTQIGNNIRYSESCPRDGKYALQKKFTGITFVPPGILPQMTIELKAQMYEHYNGPIHVAVIAIYPASIRERLDEKLLTALETFSVTNQLPKLPAGAAGAGAAGGGTPQSNF